MTAWRPDLLDGFEQLSLPITEPQVYPGEPEDTEITATLVRAARRLDDAGEPGRTAVLYVHGWNDYFFQRHLADYWTRHGYAFHAIDLRRYGRSYREGQLFGFTTDLTEYFVELDRACEVIASEYPRLLLMGHSTGGLIASLYAAERRSMIENGTLVALVLNSPWLDLQGSQTIRTLGPPMVQSLSTLRPTTPLPLPDPGFHRRATHLDHDGEWDYDLTLKGGEISLVRAGWLQAVLNGHQRVARGLGIGCPVLVLAAGRTLFRRSWDEEMMRSDIVLDVRQIASRAVRLGPLVTVARIADGMHDLLLSAAPVRERTFAEITRWCGAYAPAQPAPEVARDEWAEVAAH
ncbi:alpha/beta hydrolase [Naumannella huperziae]